MAGDSNYLAGLFLAWLKGSAMPSPPAALYVGLFNGDPGDAGTGGAEVTTTIRTAGRVVVTYGATSGKTMTNSAAVNFGNAASGANLTHFGIFDAASGGNFLSSGALSSGSGNVTAGTGVSFPAGQLSWTE